MNKIKIIENSALKLLQGDILKAKEIINEEYPFQVVLIGKRRYTDKQKMEQFVKDGFISRCSYPLLIQYLNEKCNSNFKTTENDFKKIEDFQNGDELIEYLEHFCDFCAYCTDKKLRRFKWQTSNKNNLSDYIV